MAGRPPPPGTSMHVRRTQLASEGIPFPFRLARVSFPRLTRGAIAYDVDGGFLSITEDPINVGDGPYDADSPRPNGMTFRCPNAINGNMGRDNGISRNVQNQAGTDGKTEGLEMRAHIEQTVDVLNKSFATTYATTTAPQLDLTAADFTNTSLDKPKLEEVGTKKLNSDQDTALWEALYAIVGDPDGAIQTVDGSQLENLARKRNKAAHADIRRMLKGVIDDELENEIIEIVRFPRLPVSRYSKYLDYGTGINRILEDGSRSMTAKLEKALKERSVEILKTIINSYAGDGNGRANRVDVKNYDVSKPGGAGNLEPDVPKTSTMPEYTINEAIRGGVGYPDLSASILNDLTVAPGREDNAKKNNELLRFWRSYSDEIQLKEGLDVWKFAIFEWEPYIRAGASEGAAAVKVPGVAGNVDVTVPKYTWPDVFPNPEWKNSFVQSRLVDPRYTIATSFMLDDDKIQQYWAWAPERPENVKSLMLKFHDGVKNQNLAQFEGHRIDTFDILSGFNTADNDVAKLLLDLRGITYDVFTRYRPDAGVIQQINRKVLPVSATGRNKITIDVRAIGASELRYLNDLPTLNDKDLPHASGDQMKTVWAYTVDHPENFGEIFENKMAQSVAASGISIVPGVDDGSEPLKERFLIQTETSNFKMRPIVAPVINRVLRQVREHINNRPISELTENEYELRQFEEKFTNWFRPKTNVYLQHIFGQALNNALTPAMIGSSKITNDVVLAYRTVAQKLLDSIAFAHNLGLREALHVFHVDVCNRLIKIAQTMDDPKTEAVMKQVAYAVCVEHPVVGLDLEAKRRSYKTISANVDVLRSAVKAGRAERARNSPGFVSDSGYNNGYPNVMPSTVPDITLTGERRTDEKIWKNYDYWALVLLDEDYFRFHTYGTAGIDTVAGEVQSKKDILGKLTHGGEREFDLERAEPELSDILNPSAARYEDSDQVNKRMGGRPRKEGDAPKRSRKEARKNIRKNYAGLR